MNQADRNDLELDKLADVEPPVVISLEDPPSDVVLVEQYNAMYEQLTGKLEKEKARADEAHIRATRHGNKLGGKECKIKRLEKEVAQWKSDYNRDTALLRDKLAKAMQTLDSNPMVQELTQRAAEEENLRRAYQKRIEELEADLKSDKRSCEHLEAKWRGREESWHKELQSYKVSNNEQEVVIRQLKAELEQQEALRDDIRADYEKMLNDLRAEHNAKVQELRERGVPHDRYAEMKTMFENAKRNYETVLEDLRQAQTDLNYWESKAERLRDKKDKWKGRYKELRSNYVSGCDGRDLIIDEHNNTINELRRLNERLGADNKVMSEVIDNYANAPVKAIAYDGLNIEPEIQPSTQVYPSGRAKASIEKTQFREIVEKVTAEVMTKIVDEQERSVSEATTARPRPQPCNYPYDLNCDS